MPKPRIAVFSGQTATVSNSPSLVTSNKARKDGEPKLPGPSDHLVAQRLYEPVEVKIRKFSAHPLEEDSKEVYHDDGADYYVAKLRPEDGTYLLPYMARRAAHQTDGMADGVPFEEADAFNPAIGFGGRQFFYPDASRIFEDIDRSITGRNAAGASSALADKADYDFIRALPPGGFTKQGEVAGVDYFPYYPPPISKLPPAGSLARLTNEVWRAMSSGNYVGGLWLEGSPSVEETVYWLSLLIDSDLPLAGVAAQRTHGQLSADGDRNIVDAIDYVVSGAGRGIGTVGVVDERIYAAREFKKADDRPGNYKATGGHGGILGSVGPPVTVWYRPNYRHTTTSAVRITELPDEVRFADRVGGRDSTAIRIKDADGDLLGTAIPRVYIVKTGTYMAEDVSADPDDEVDIMARIAKANQDQGAEDASRPRLHGFIMEGYSPYGVGTMSQMAALEVASYSGLVVVRVGRSDPGGMVPPAPIGATVNGSNLDANKARLLLMACLLRFGRPPRARDSRNPTIEERQAVAAKISEFQEVFSTH